MGTVEELRKLAEAATLAWDGVDLLVAGNPIQNDAVGAFIGRLTPATILALLDERDSLLAALQQMLAPWEGLSYAELHRRASAGLLHIPRNDRIRAARIAIARATP